MRLGRLVAAALFVFLSACDPQPALDKAGFVRLFAYAGTVRLEVNPDTTCPTFPNVTATQNGIALTQFEKGGTLGVQGGHECKSPEWVMLDVPHDEAKTTFEFKDKTSSVVAEFTKLNGDRTLTVTQPANAQAQLGDAIRIQWDPAGDIFDTTGSTQVQFLFPGGASGTEQTMIVAYASAASNPGSITFANSELAFTLGDPFGYGLIPTQTTAGKLQVVSTNIWAKTTRCEGIAKCEIGIRAYPTVPFTLVR
jgi:hypothetical protein